MSKIFKEYLTKIPEDFELLLKVLGHSSRIKISLLLFKSESLSLSKIVKSLNQENSVALNHIHKLELAGVVQNYLKKSKNSREYSFYELTKYGKKIIYDLIENYNDYYNTKNKFEELSTNGQIEIPKDLELVLKGLSNNLRFALSLMFIKKGPLSFSEITNLLNKEKSSISNHLNKLETGGAIQNYLKKKKDSNDYSYYEITKFGEKIVSGLINGYNDYYNNVIKNQEKTHRKFKEV